MSKKKNLEKKKKQQSNQRLYLGICIAVLIIIFCLIGVAWWLQLSNNSGTGGNVSRYTGRDLWSINNTTGKLSFTDRGDIQVNNVTMVERGDNYTLENVSFKSFGDDVYALLRIPTNVTKPPVVIVDPARTMTKEMDEPTAEALCSMGYASLTLDQRGYGQTGGDSAADWDTGYSEFLNNSTPVQYKQIYDILKGLDYVKTRADLDGNDTAVLGESIGGMWAIDAAGIEPQFEGVITISAADFDYNGSDDPQVDEFIYAVMPSRYLSDLPPRELAMYQFNSDPVVTMDQGKALYDEAYEPKVWHLYNGSIHGVYDSAFANDLKVDLKDILGR